MIRAVSYAALFSAAVAAQGFAQNTVTPYSATNGGVVNLGNNGTPALTATIGANPSSATVAQPTSSTTTGTTATASTSSAAAASSGSGGGTSSTLSSASRSTPATSSSSARSAGSSGSATGTASSNIPAWLLCPPSGASGMGAFVTGTSLSCAP